MARRGGGIFRTAPDPITGATKLTTLSVVLILILVVGVVLAIVLPLTLLKPKDESTEQTGGGAVGPGFSKLPGRITIAELTQAPSAGQGIIYFSQAQAAGTVCDTCTAIFDISITYSGGNPQQEPVTKTVSAPSTSGTVTFDYGVPEPRFNPLQPGVANTTPPTQVQIDVTARSVSSQDPSKKSGATSFSKTIPYVA
jgi:hypothetical protein